MTKYENFFYFGIMLVLVLIAIISSNPVVYDSSNPKDSFGNLEVAKQDQHTEVIDLELSELIDYFNITINSSIDDTILTISSNTAPVVDNLVCLKEGSSFYQGDIIAVTSLGGTLYNITLDSPLDYPFSTEGGCSLREDNWAVDGSVTPRTFIVSPMGLDDNVSWDIIRVMLVCSGDGTSAPDPTPDIASFFTTDAITNGIVFRSVNGITKNLFNAKDNFHLVSETYDLTFYPASRFGLYAVSSRRTFNGDDKNGVTIRLDAVNNDTFELIIQDDLTDMDECHAIVQGHVVDV